VPRRSRASVSSRWTRLIIAGTVYRGEFESRLKQIIDEAKATGDHPLHRRASHDHGRGRRERQPRRANILKPALARGELRCIGATRSRIQEHIESDARSTAASAGPGLGADAGRGKKIIAGLRDSSRSSTAPHHGRAVKAAVDLSVRYVQDRFLPDKPSTD